jgi:hypothetical protein
MPHPYLHKLLLQGRLAVFSDESIERKNACLIVVVPVIGDSGSAEIRDALQVSQHDAERGLGIEWIVAGEDADASFPELPESLQKLPKIEPSACHEYASRIRRFYDGHNAEGSHPAAESMHSSLRAITLAIECQTA